VVSCGESIKLARRGKVDRVLGFREKPGGLQRFGGPLWMPMGAFAPTPGINQIVAHTSDAEVRGKNGKRSRNYCLDVGSASVAAVICGGRVTIRNK